VIETIKPATTMASGLKRPSSRVSSAGNPKMLFPIMELTTKAVIDHRPIERTKAKGPPLKMRTPYHVIAIDSRSMDFLMQRQGRRRERRAVTTHFAYNCLA